MTEEQRKEFEAWANSELAEWLCPYVDDLKEYMGEVMQSAWLSWQAGRVPLLREIAKLREALGKSHQGAPRESGAERCPTCGNTVVNGRCRACGLDCRPRELYCRCGAAHFAPGPPTPASVAPKDNQ